MQNFKFIYNSMLLVAQNYTSISITIANTILNDLEYFFKAIQINATLQELNFSNKTKPISTDDQIKKISTIYSKDLELYNSLS